LTLAPVVATLPQVAWYVVCESGQRATISASYLLHYGHSVAGVVTPGGMSDYNATYPDGTGNAYNRKLMTILVCNVDAIM
jgi:rhodanese-related sulfurtransferase